MKLYMRANTTQRAKVGSDCFRSCAKKMQDFLWETQQITLLVLHTFVCYEYGYQNLWISYLFICFHFIKKYYTFPREPTTRRTTQRSIFHCNRLQFYCINFFYYLLERHAVKPISVPVASDLNPNRVRHVRKVTNWTDWWLTKELTQFYCQRASSSSCYT